ncbi:MAG: pantetheine-phosphate adenylyltransferase [Phycisphaerae bacterium]|nr:pantetheine-phosphate adenylyltransferase [Phycisphaerae bacterium]
MCNAGKGVVAVYPGSFDPITFGHLDVIQRAARLFNEVVVGIGRNPNKQELFTPEERLELISPHTVETPNVRVDIYSGLTIDFVRQCGGNVLLRGIRDVNDLSHELQQANVNRMIGNIETIFMLTGDEYVLTSSTYIRQIYELGGRSEAPIQRLVPPNVVAAMEHKLGKP